MQDIIGSVECVVSALNALVWGPAMMGLLLVTGIWLSIRAGFPQLRRFGEMLQVTLGSAFAKKKDRDDTISPFQAVSTALAGTVGTGNIAGVAGAVTLGGPGAVFWMWFSAFWGMATKYAEVVLAVRFRERNGAGEWRGGPMYTIQNGLGPCFRPLAALFSMFGMLAAFGIGNLAQVNTLVGAATSVLEALIPGNFSDFPVRLVVGLLTATAVGLALLGGVQRIGAVAERLVPTMSVIYITGALAVIFSHAGTLPEVLRSVFVDAFTPHAVLGGAAGIGMQQAVRLGVARGIFSNEAGLGSAPIAHSATSETDSARQGLFGIFEVFVDTIVICTLTALAILTSGVEVPYGSSAGAKLTISAFSSSFGGKTAGVLISICLVFFAFSSVLSWSLYGCRCAEYLFGKRAADPYNLLFSAASVLGAVCELSLVWNVSEALNGLMAIPNLISLLALSGVVARAGETSSKAARRHSSKYKKDAAG